MKHFSKMTMAAVAMISFFTACNNVEDLDDLKKPGTENPGGGTEDANDGTQEKPFTVAEVIALNPQSTTEAVKTGVWVTGYIVGNYDYDSDPKNQLGQQDAYPSDLNVYLATSKDETNYKNCISVQIVASMRDAVGLKTNPSNFGKTLKIKGDVMKYNSIPGLKLTTDFELEGYTPEGGGDDNNGDLSSVVVTSLDYDFNDVVNNNEFKKEGWTNMKVTGDRTWQCKVYESNGYAQATAHNATADVNHEYWLYTPGLDLDKAQNKNFTFSTATDYWTASTVFKVWVVNATDKTKTELHPTLPTDTHKDFLSAGDIDLSGFSGVVYIGFQYIGEGGSSKSTTWRIDDVKFNYDSSAPEATTVAVNYSTASVETNAAYDCAITTTVANGVGATVITAEGVPAWATFADNGDGTASIKGTAPAAAEESTITIKAVNNNVEATKTFTLKVTAPSEAGSELVINGGFETWGDEAKPTGWDSDYTMPVITKSTDIKHSGNNALRQTSTDATLKVQQEIAVTPGKTYKLSYWYLDNDTNASSKFWGAWVDGANKAIDADKATLQWAKFSTDSAEWQYVEVTVTAPENAALIRFETRTYRGATADGSSLADKGVNGGYIYYDDFSMIEVQ